MVALGDPRRHAPVLAVLRPGQIALQAARDRAPGRRRRLDRAVLQRPDPGVRLGLEARRRAPAADQVPDLVERDEVGDLAADRRNRDLRSARPASGSRARAPRSRPARCRARRRAARRGPPSARTPRLHRRGRRSPRPGRRPGHTSGMAEATPIRLALAQIDATVGDVEGNQRLIAGQIERARDGGADLVVLPELCLSGYPPEDLLFRDDFLDAVPRGARVAGRRGRGHRRPGRLPRARRDARRAARGPDQRPARPRRPQLARRARGRRGRRRLPQDPPAQLRRLRREPLLPARDRAGADRARRRPGRAHRLRGHLGPGLPRERRGGRGRAADRQLLGLPLRPRQGRRARAHGRRARALQQRRVRALQHGRRPGRARSSTAAASSSRPTARSSPAPPSSSPSCWSATCCCPPRTAAPSRGRRLLLARTHATAGRPRATPTSGSPSLTPRSARSTRRSPWASATTCEKNGFEAVVLGLSGGIDSALVAMVAADALGPERVSCVVMPSPHSSDETQADARAIAANLGAEPDRAADRRPDGGLRARARRPLRRHRARDRRGEPAGADPGQPADGALEQVRLAGADDRQQVRDGGRLRDALRRHGRAASP